MLSFDITDRNIRVVKGTESNGKIKITAAATVDLEPGLIVNGHVKDVPNVATLINGVIKMNKMPDKDAIISISSNLTIFKELTVTKTKGMDMQKLVKSQMQSELNLDESYSVTYVIVGEAEEKSSEGDPIYKVLATACPYEIINSYREVFKYMPNTSLKSVVVGCNCITKVLLADTKIKAKMPLLAVQIDNNFISLNLYENGQLSFSRFASIDPDDYNGSDDYVFEAVNENIFRMLQFHRSRNTGESISNIIFYGDTHDYVKLTDELEKLELNTSLINVPPQIHGHENLEFSLYANAIGAMFKRNRETEKINLLESEFGAIMKSGGGSGNDQQGMIVLLGCIGVAALIVGGIYGVMAIRDKSIKNEIQEIEDFINAPETLKQLDHQEKLLFLRDETTAYETKMNNASDAYYSLPVIDGDKFDGLEKVLEKTASELKITDARMLGPSYANGVFSFTINAKGSGEMVQKLPAQYIMNLTGKDIEENGKYYADAVYTGYAVSIAAQEIESVDAEGNSTTVKGEEEERVAFNVVVDLNPRKSAYHPIEEEDGATEAAADAAAAQ